MPVCQSSQMFVTTLFASMKVHSLVGVLSNSSLVLICKLCNPNLFCMFSVKIHGPVGHNAKVDALTWS